MWKKYVGEFEFEAPFTLTLSIKGDHLFAKLTGQNELQLFAESEVIFFLKEVNASIEFKVENGKVDSLILKQRSNEMQGKRIK